MAAVDSRVKLAAAAAAAAGLVYLAVRRAGRSKVVDRAPPGGESFLDFFRLVRAGSLTDLMAQGREKYGDFFITSAPPLFSRIFVVMGIEEVRAITAMESKLDMAEVMPPSYQALHGKDLQLLKGSPHKQWRRALNPAVVSPRALASYLPKLQAAFQKMWRDLAAEGGTVVIRDHVRRTQTRAMADVLYGLTFSVGRRLRGRGRGRVHDAARPARHGLPQGPPGGEADPLLPDGAAAPGGGAAAVESGPASSGGGWRQPEAAANAIHAMAELHESPDAEIKGLVASEELVVSNLLLLLEAAQASTTNAITALIGRLHEPGCEGILARARSEVQSALAGKESLSTEAFDALEYCDACVNETLRLYPFATAVVKELPAGRTLEVAGYEVHGPTSVFLSFGHAFEDPALFPRPPGVPARALAAEADPAIAAGDAARRAFLPFGLGPHVCIGQGLARLSIKAALAALFLGSCEVELQGAVGRVPDILPAFRTSAGVHAHVREVLPGKNS
eukprot:CAMPEP_0175311260 /NCGR_PEP_ID=MMETSP0093-20121207/66748_1 /TAXON_ID=311494 /ORGANISM="Alexandrium monilatum, Strain CCMP3105" /LENGTH=504 /DNA_ID=CAMNT_0016607873 /DNA_START=81 /DNA_END=1594 /DNA_ORIENTATION=-